jgi:putative chitinase
LKIPAIFINYKLNNKMILLKKGSQGQEVTLLQQLLELNSDGIFGFKTEKAVMKWQSEEGLLADGVVGLKTWSSLQCAFPEEVTLNTGEPTPEDVKKLEGLLSKVLLKDLSLAILSFEISSNLRLAHFLAQCAHESGGFKKVEENLNYSEKRLLQVFPRYFSRGSAIECERNPQKIASKVYANRMGNGDEMSGDGYRYRGRGFIQLTGKDNYSIFRTFVKENIVLKPELVATKYALTSAAFYFQKNNLWKVCDLGATDKVVAKVTKIVNGGQNGLVDRIRNFDKFWTALN